MQPIVNAAATVCRVDNRVIVRRHGRLHSLNDRLVARVMSRGQLIDVTVDAS